MWFAVGSVKPGATVIFDVDGVIMDVSRRLQWAKQESGGDRERFWRLFLDPAAALLYDRPNPIAVLEARRLARVYQLVLVTGRPLYMRRATQVQLARAGVPYSALVFRTGRVPAPTYKRAVLEWLRGEGADIVEVHDDSESVLRMARAVMPSARLVLWQENGKPRIYNATLKLEEQEQ